MSDEVRDRESGGGEAGAKLRAAAAVNKNQKLATQEEQITKPAPKVKPQKEKDPKKVAAGKKLAEKNRQAKAALEREVKREREIAEREQKNENSEGWFPEMSFQTVLPIVGIAFTAFEMYQRFRQKESSPRAEPKHSGGDRESCETAGAKLGAPTSETPSTDRRLSQKLGMV